MTNTSHILAHHHMSYLQEHDTMPILAKNEVRSASEENASFNPDHASKAVRVDAVGEEDQAFLHVPRGWTLEKIEKAVVLQTLDRHHGNRTQTAKSLGISVRTLQRRLKSWNRNQPRLDT